MALILDQFADGLNVGIYEIVGPARWILNGICPRINSKTVVKGGKDLQTEEDIFTVKEDATKGQIRSAFRKFSKGKLENRMMLSKFVDMVAA